MYDPTRLLDSFHQPLVTGRPVPARPAGSGPDGATVAPRPLPHNQRRVEPQPVPDGAVPDGVEPDSAEPDGVEPDGAAVGRRRSGLAAIGEDLLAAYARDPALHGSRVAELVLYPGLWALWTHRAAHELHSRNVPWLPRLLSQGARLLTGIEIHPGARVGRRCFIDHGMGVVIGETAEVGDDVTIYHGVTLGARGFWRDEKGAKRHPTIGDGVVLGARSSVLGPVTVADGCRVGAHALVVSDVPAGTTVTALPAVAHRKERSAPTLLEYEI